MEQTLLCIFHLTSEEDFTKKYGEFFPTLKPDHVSLIGRVPKKEFEKEEL